MENKQLFEELKKCCVKLTEENAKLVEENSKLVKENAKLTKNEGFLNLELQYAFRSSQLRCRILTQECGYVICSCGRFLNREKSLKEGDVCCKCGNLF